MKLIVEVANQLLILFCPKLLGDLRDRVSAHLYAVVGPQVLIEDSTVLRSDSLAKVVEILASIAVPWNVLKVMPTCADDSPVTRRCNEMLRGMSYWPLELTALGGNRNIADTVPVA